MNSFDVVVYLGLVVAVVTGFNAGLLRSAVTILAYLIAMPIAVWVMSLVAPAIDGKSGSPWAENSVVFFGIFLLAGIVLVDLLAVGGAPQNVSFIFLILFVMALVFQRFIPAT